MTIKTVLSATPGTHAEANGHWDVAMIERNANPAKPEMAETLATIKFQNGPVNEHGVNGVQLTDVLKVALARYEMLNQGDFRCRENSLVITNLQQAIFWDLERTEKRTKAGVEGYDKPRTA